MCTRLRTKVVHKSKSPMEQSTELRILKFTEQMTASIVKRINLK